MKMSLALIGFFGTLVTASPTFVWGEDSKFTNAELVIYSASRVVSAGTSRTFSVGTEVVFPKIPTFSAPDKVAVRLFALSENSNIPDSWAKFDPCIVYWSSLYPVHFEAGVIKLFTVGAGWLEAMKSGQVKSRRYLMLFEKGEGDSHNMIRIQSDNVASYFSQGAVIIIEPERQYSTEEGKSLAERQFLAREQAMAIASKNVPEYRCYVAKPSMSADALPASGETPDLGMVYGMNDCAPELFLP